MNAPTNMVEYIERFGQNQRVEGYFLNTTTFAPCPFCAAPDFASWSILEAERVMAEESTCKECGRSAKALFSRDSGGVQFEFVQTGGPDQPEWLQPKMRRVAS